MRTIQLYLLKLAGYEITVIIDALMKHDEKELANKILKQITSCG